MTNAPESRSTHVVRLVGTNDDGDVLQDIWIDLERMDVVKSRTQSGGTDEGLQRKLRWFDDPTQEGYDDGTNPARITKYVKVCSPDEDDIDNPVEYVKVPVIKGMKSRGYVSDTGDGSMDRFRNNEDGDDIVTSRKFVVRRIVHYDTNIDDDAQTAFDDDDTLTAYVVKGSDYTRDDDTKDDSQYVEHEIITYYKPRDDDNSDKAAGSVSTGRQTKLLNQYLIDESDEPDNEIVGISGTNPPYRLDPYQNIINVNLGSLAVEFFDGAQ